MLLPPLRQFRRNRRPARRPPAPALLGATYVAGTSLTLVFDRAIDVSALVGGVILVDDGPGGAQYEATLGAVLVDPQTVRLALIDLTGFAGPDVRLNAAAGNGIAPAGGGAAWAGVTDLLLPYP